MYDVSLSIQLILITRNELKSSEWLKIRSGFSRHTNENGTIWKATAGILMRFVS